MIDLEIPRKLQTLAEQAHQVARHVFRPISRKYDRREHDKPKELDMFAAVLDGMNDGGGDAGAGGLRAESKTKDAGPKNGSNMATVLGMIEMCWGDVGLALSIPGQGLGNAAIYAVATDEQKKRFGRTWAAMAITEPEAGSDSAAIRTTAKADGDQWILNGEKIFVTAGDRCDSVVVWATLDPAVGRAAIKSFVVPKGTPGMEVVGLEKKLGIRASDTATIRLTDCRIPRDNILGSPEIKPRAGFGGVMQTFDNTRPVVAAMAIGLGRASLELTTKILRKEGIIQEYRGNLKDMTGAERSLYEMEAELESARLLTMKSAWLADNGIANSMEASMAKAKAGRVSVDIALRCVELCGGRGYSEEELLEKWARDAKILDIFEGTQQIQMLVIARRLLGKSSAELH